MLEDAEGAGSSNNVDQSNIVSTTVVQEPQQTPVTQAVKALLLLPRQHQSTCYLIAAATNVFIKGLSITW